MVHAKQGLVGIDKLKVGDWVLSRPENPEDGTEPSYKRVVNTFRHEAKEIVEFMYEIGNDPNPYKNLHFRVTATLNHSFWLAQEGWTSVEMLNKARDYRPSFVLTDGTPSFAGTFSRIYRTDVVDRGWIATRDLYGDGELVEYCPEPKLIDNGVMFDKENWPGDAVDDDIFQPFQTTVYNIEVEDFHTTLSASTASGCTTPTARGSSNAVGEAQHRSASTTAPRIRALLTGRRKRMHKSKQNPEFEAGFVAGTLVHTREGLRPIEQIRVGDYVLTKPEDGSGDTSYKRVARTIESEAQETWYVSWEDPGLNQQWKQGLPKEDFYAAYGNGFVVSTPNHPFWVVDSSEFVQYEERAYLSGPPFPKECWIRADHLVAGMQLLLAYGRIVRVLSSCRVYKTDAATQGWVSTLGDGEVGTMIDFSGGAVEASVHPHATRYTRGGSSYDGMVPNPNDSYADDYPPGNAPESWYLSKVYNIEVEGDHSYFVDTMGVWVHDTMHPLSPS